MALEFKNIENDKEWDELVFSLPEYSFLLSSARYQYSQRNGLKPYRIGIFNNDIFLGVIFCYIGYSKLFGKYLECKHSPTLMENRVEYWDEILEYLKILGNDNGCFMIRFAPLSKENEQITEFYKKQSMIKAPIHNVDALISQHIDLTKDIEELRRDMNKTKRNLLNRLLKDSNVSVKIFNDDSQFDVFKDFHLQTTKLKGYTDKPVNLLIEEFKDQISNDMFYILVGYYKNTPIGFWQCTRYGKNLHLYQAGTDTEFREMNINISYLLFWETVKLGKELGCEKLDLFGGVVPENYVGKNHPWSGIGNFKESLGGNKETYMHSRDYPLKSLIYKAYSFTTSVRTKLKGYTTDW